RTLLVETSRPRKLKITSWITTILGFETFSLFVEIPLWDIRNGNRNQVPTIMLINSSNRLKISTKESTSPAQEMNREPKILRQLIFVSEPRLIQITQTLRNELNSSSSKLSRV